MDIKGFETLYTIDKDGKVYSIKSNRYLKGRINHFGYLEVCLTKDKKEYNIKVHRLLAEHFIPNPENKPIIDHINRIKTDNRLDNLRWVDYRQNAENVSISHRNKLQEQNICKDNIRNRFIFQIKRDGIIHRKYFKTFEKALEYKQNYLNN